MLFEMCEVQPRNFLARERRDILESPHEHLNKTSRTLSMPGHDTQPHTGFHHWTDAVADGRRTLSRWTEQAYSSRVVNRCATTKQRKRQVPRKSWIFLVLTLSICCLPLPSQCRSLTGKTVACTEEGSEVNVPALAADPCYKCYCRGGEIQCDQARCPALEGCHAVLFSKPEGECCDVCKGCTVEGDQMPHGASWPDRKDPCLIRTCNAGVVTTAVELCTPPCDHPVKVPGQCCPSCSGCSYNGTNYMSGETFIRDADDGAAVECKCMVGSVTCSRRACPVLNCPAWATHKLPGHRCPSCKGQRTIFDVPGSCYLSQKVYSQGDTHRPDKCTACRCQHGTMLCEREQCGELACSESERVFPPGACCPVCQNQKSCDADGRKVKHGELWQRDACNKCTCEDGVWLCSLTQCPALSCAKGFIAKTGENSCCPTCVQEHATCSMFGKSSDRIVTFGRLRYRTQGFCLHELVRDCGEGEVSIKVRFELGPGGLNTRGQAQGQERSQAGINWNQLDQVSIKFGSTNVKLFRNGRIRVNRTSGIPFAKNNISVDKGRVISKRTGAEENVGADAVARKELSISVRAEKVFIRLLKLGITVTWNVAKSNLKVKVDAERYQGDRRLCGLCGSVRADDDGSMRHTDSEVTRNKRFEPVLPSYMAWAWRRGHVCRERERTVRGELKRQATRDSDRFHTEVISLLNKMGNFSAKNSSLNPNYNDAEEALFVEPKLFSNSSKLEQSTEEEESKLHGNIPFGLFR